MPADAGREKAEGNMSGASSGSFSGSSRDLFSLSESLDLLKKSFYFHIFCAIISKAVGF